ncbi:MAG: hypothetical protein QXO22_04275 [Thermosphaera sp.]
MSSPTITLTRTIYRFVRKDGTVVKEVIVEPGGKLLLNSLTTDELSALLTKMIEDGDVRAVQQYLKLPPYLQLVVPQPPADASQQEVWRAYLAAEISKALNPDYRKSMLLRHLNSVKGTIISRAVEEGVQRDEAERLFKRLLSEVRNTSTLGEVIKYEGVDPVNYIVSLGSVSRVRVAA